MTSSVGNPLLQPWQTLHGLPPFAAIRPEHFLPAFEVAMAEHRAEVEAIGAAPEPPTFENTIAAFDRAGLQLARVELLSSFSTLLRRAPTMELVRQPEWKAGYIIRGLKELLVTLQ